MEFKGTEGEWSVRRNLKLLEVFSSYGTICVVARQSSIYSNVDSVAEANAKLISCAPEMLEIINELIQAIKNEDIIIKDNTDNDGFEVRGFYFYNKFNSLIKKATE